MELLAPAGNLECAFAALGAGADAIYVGLDAFNARRAADNFTLADLEELCRVAHLAGARVYVTENIVIKTSEMAAALELARGAWVAGADGLIIQDWGLLAEIRRAWPEIECHVSTQANVHDAPGLAWARDMGATRVTLSRELSLAEIAAIAQVNTNPQGELECEVFGHGALCFCYSGLCLLSSSEGPRSANRGLCAQPCRLAYDLVDTQGTCLNEPGATRPLCPKDACTIDDVAQLAEAGVASLKIEGRRKAPEYVYAVTSAYRQVLDAYEAGGEPTPPPEVRRRLARVFNRDFTDAYLWGRSGSELMSYERSNNRGQLVGEVLSSVRAANEVYFGGGGEGGRGPRKHIRRNAETRIRLTEPVGAGDLLEIRPADDPSRFLTAQVREDAPAGSEISVRTRRVMAAGSAVRLIRSQEIIDETQQVIAAYAAGGYPRKRLVAARVVLRLGEPLTLELACGETRVQVAGAPVEAARTKAITAAEVREHVGRMGATPFELAACDVVLDEGCGVGFSALHALRAEATQALEQALLVSWEGRAARLAPLHCAPQAACAAASRPAAPEICALAATPEAARAALEAGATRIYADAAELAAASGWPAGTIPVLGEVSRPSDWEIYAPLLVPGAPCAVGTVGELRRAAEAGAQPELRSCIPVHNPAALHTLCEAGATSIWLSGELSLSEIAELAPVSPVPLGVTVSGRARVMTSEHCILQVAGRCIHDCARCSLRCEHTFLCDEHGKLLPVRTGLNGRSRLYAAAPLDAVPQIGELMAAGVSRFLVDGTLLAPDELAAEVKRTVAAMAAVQAGRLPAPRRPGATSGHLFEPVR